MYQEICIIFETFLFFQIQMVFSLYTGVALSNVPIVCLGQVENSETSEMSEISEIFFRLFLFRLFDFDLIHEIENSEEENSENKFRRFRRFRRFQVIDLPLFDLTLSSDRLSFFTLYGFFCFLFLLCLNFLFQAIVLRLSNMQIYVQSGTNKEQFVYICPELKKLTKLLSVRQEDRVVFKLRQVNLHNLQKK